MRFLRNAYESYTKMLEVQTPAWTIDDALIDMRESFDSFASQCDVCMRWTKTYHERTNIRINLVSTT
jgi:hypothetical protein